MKNYIIATDGACKGNPGPGTWAFVVFDTLGNYVGHKKGHLSATTNNSMELRAFLEAITWLEKHKLSANILTDSYYVINGARDWIRAWKNNNWITKGGTPVKNKELWVAVSQNTATFTTEKVKGHSGNKYNEMADMYCNEEYINTYL